MSRILIISSDFPPLNTIAVRRVAGFAKYLARMSWEVTVLTGDPRGRPQDQMTAEECFKQSGLPPERVIHVPFRPHVWPKTRLLKKLAGAARTAVLPGSIEYAFGRAIAEAAGDLQELDVILASFPGAGAFLGAARLSKALRVPWIADFRDTPHALVTAPAWFRRFTFSRLWRLARWASACIAVSPTIAGELQRAGARQVSLIPNGYDPEMYEGCRRSPGRDVFRMAYTGTIFASEDVNPVIRAIEELADAGRIARGEIQLSLYGPSVDCVAQPFRHCLGKTVHIHPRVSPSACAQLQCEATVLLVLAMPRYEGMLTGKLFEYMAAGRPVLSYPCDRTGIDAVLTRAGIGASCNSVEELKAMLSDWHRQWKQTGDIAMARNPTEIAKWNRAEQTQALAALCEQVVASATRGPAERRSCPAMNR